MICIPAAAIEQKAAKMPVTYLQDCKAMSLQLGDRWCFEPKDYHFLRKKYRGYAVSESDRFREGAIISGCCDRADQY